MPIYRAMQVDPTEYDDPERQGWRAACLIAAAVALGIAIHIRDGLVHPGAILWLTIALALTAASLLRPAPGSRVLPRVERGLPFLLAGGIGLQFVLIFFSQIPGGWRGGGSTLPFYAGLTAAAATAVAMVTRPARARALFAILLVCFALIGIWLLRSGGRPRIDVWTAQMAGLDALSHGHDPWSSSFPDVYHIAGLYAPGTVRDGVVHLGFPYPPLSVWLDLPGYLAFGDFRYSNLAAILLAAACIAYARPGHLGPLLATLLLFTPRGLLVLRNGWTEPQVAMLLAATVFCACRFPRAMPWLFGLFLVSKQYLILAAVPALLLLERPWTLRRGLIVMAKAAVAGAIVSLPLAAWNLKAFGHSNFTVAAGAGFRLDALSYFAYLGNVLGWTPPSWLGCASFLAAAAATLLVLRRSPRSASGFAGGAGLVFLAFFALNKFAFCNYYYFIIACLCTAVSAMRPRESAAAAESPPDVQPEPARRAA